MTSPLDRVRALIAKAVDHATRPSEVDEARTTALIAVQMIVEHDLLRAAAPQAGAVTDTPAAAVNLDDFFSAMQAARRRRDAASRPPAGSRPWGSRARGPREPPAPPVYRPMWWETLPAEIWISTDRRCVVCGLRCDAGDVVWAVATTIEDGVRRPVVCHLGCAEHLPEDQRRVGVYCAQCGRRVDVRSPAVVRRGGLVYHTWCAPP